MQTFWRQAPSCSTLFFSKDRKGCDCGIRSHVAWRWIWVSPYKLCTLRAFIWPLYATSMKWNDYSTSLMKLFKWISKLIPVNSSYLCIILILILSSPNAPQQRAFAFYLFNLMFRPVSLELPSSTGTKNQICPRGILTSPTLARLKLPLL